MIKLITFTIQQMDQQYWPIFWYICTKTKHDYSTVAAQGLYFLCSRLCFQIWEF